MKEQMSFKRYELKYILTLRQKERLITLMKPYMELDRYGRSTIRSVYYDTDSYRLVRHSIEKPAYKEKLRVRSYGRPVEGEPVFVELKKKYRSVVYKRRVSMPEGEAYLWLRGDTSESGRGQIYNEIEYFRDFYETLHPAAFVSYEREAYLSKAEDGLRVTFDENILCREDDLSLSSGIWGASLLDGDLSLMELKTSMAVPLWMSRFLSCQQIYRSSFSKYGAAYQSMILKDSYGGKLYA